ncbi:MAG: LysR family transcriptional regulator [Ramlibacter sp.]|nr:LysR family transcriptional regulator [Ramlibacter sp.]
MERENWDDLRVVLAVSRTQSFSAAAQVLKVNESTVLRKVAQAEQRLRARLFERKRGVVTLTRAGEELIERAVRVEDLIIDATDSIRGADSRVSGVVRVTSVALLVNRLLLPALPGLLAGYPGLQVELVAESRVLSLGRREADIALRLARPVDSMRAVARKVGALHYAVYAPRDGDAAALPWLTYEASAAHVAPAEWIARNAGDNTLSQIRVNDAEGLLACVQNGLGKTVLPHFIGDTAPGVRRVENFHCDLSRELWLVVHPDLRKLDRVRLLMDWVIAVCAGLSGAPPSGPPPGTPQ